MAIPLTEPISMTMVRNELNQSTNPFIAAGTAPSQNMSLYRSNIDNTGANTGYATLNPMSQFKPNKTNPAQLSEFRGYSQTEIRGFEAVIIPPVFLSFPSLSITFHKRSFPIPTLLEFSLYYANLHTFYIETQNPTLNWSFTLSPGDYSSQVLQFSSYAAVIPSTLWNQMNFPFTTISKNSYCETVGYNSSFTQYFPVYYKVRNNENELLSYNL
jgi:hypothetical protein